MGGRVAYRDLRDFVRKLEKEGELKRVRTEVDPNLEITEIVQRVGRGLGHGPGGGRGLRGQSGQPGMAVPHEGNYALLFEKVRGSRVPLVVNTFGSVRRMCLAFEVSELDEVAARIRGFMDMQSPAGLFDKIKMLPKLAELGSFFPKTVKTGDCKDVRRHGKDVNLFDFPILKCWPQDGGRFITFPLVFTRNPETGKRNVGMYRMQVYDERTTGMHWQTQKHGAEHFRRARAANPEGRIPVAVAIGSDPATALAGMLPIPPDLDEMMFAGLLRRDSVEMVPCETNDLEGPAPQEDFYMGYAVERVFLPVMKMQYPEIVDVAMPAEGIFHNLMIVAIRKSYPGHARKIMNAIWSLGQAMFTKVIVVVDHDVDIHNFSEVVWKTLCALDPERDVQFVFGPTDTLDHAARMQDYGSKMGIDATRKWASEGFTRPWPDEILMDSLTKAKIDSIWKSLGL